MNWIEGRQGTGYHKLKLFECSNWDLYVLKYDPGSYIPYHIDPVPGKNHWRINLRLCGYDTFQGVTRFRFGRLIVFRPDRSIHCVKPSLKKRLVLSLGFITDK